MYVGGEWASRRAGNNERLQLKAMAIIYCVYAVLSIFIYLSPNHYFAFAMMSLGSVVSSLGVCCGATTDTGWGSKVSTLSEPSITSRWPR